MNKLLWSIWLILLSSNLSAQQFGANPASNRWKQLNTDTVRVIYPSGGDSAAQRVAAIVQRLANRNVNSLGGYLKKVNIVLQPQTILSNGYVSMGPFRSEFYLTPPADNFSQGGLRWIDQLALHEYRHVQQYNNLDWGASRIMKRLFGQEGYAVATNAAVPNWFFEGDAVYQETALSPQGRGRLPAFLKDYPALWRSGKDYSWMKLRNGSYKDFVPDHYRLGYLLVQYGYEQFGPLFWGKVTRDAAAYKGLFYPFQSAIKRHTGEPYHQFVKNALARFREKYHTAVMQPGTQWDSAWQVMSIDAKTLRNYYYPISIGTDSLLYLKSTATQRPAFYIRDKKGEHFIRYRDIGNDRQFSYQNGRLAYAATETHPRWAGLTYSVIRVLDVKTGYQQSVGHRSRYFAPDVSPDGRQVLVNQVSLNGRSQLLLLEISSGKILRQFSSTEVEYFSSPKIKNYYQVVAAIRNKNGQMYIGVIDWNQQKITPITPPSYKAVGQIQVRENRVYFIGANGLRDDMYWVDIPSRKIYQFGQSAPASYFVHAGADRLVWSTFTADGFQLRQAKDTLGLWKAVTAKDFGDGENGWIHPGGQLDSGFLHLASRRFPSKGYPKLFKPFNFHSWRPNYADPEYSVTFYGNNILNTVNTELYYVYNENDRTSSWGGSILYGGLYPVIGLGSRYTLDRQQYQGKYLRKWDQWDNYLSVSVPLNWNHGTVYRFLNGATQLGFRQDFNKEGAAARFPMKSFGYLNHTLSYGEQAPRAMQDIYPRWGYSISGGLRYSIRKFKSWQGVLRANMFLPGLLPAHSWVLTGGLQAYGSTYRMFGSQLNFARGYYAIDSARMGAATMNYHFPLFYPDWGFGNLLYITRLRANMFFDVMGLQGKKNKSIRSFKTAGAELFFDTQWWNQYPLTLGLRGGYLLNSDPLTPKRRWFYEFILPVSLIPR